MKKPKRKRILMLLENCSFPKDDRVRREVKSLISEDYHVSVICPKDKKESLYEVINGVIVYRYLAPEMANGFLAYLWEYSYSMAAIFLLSLFVFFRHGFDIIHTHQPPDTFAFIAAFYKIFGKYYVLDHHDLAPELYYARFGGNGNKFIYRFLIQIEKFACRLADHVIATNQSYKLLEMQRGGVEDRLITIVRNGPDLDDFRFGEPIESLKSNGRTIIGYVGVINQQDGVDYLLRALNYMINNLDRSDFLCVLVGDGSALVSLKALANQLGLNEYILFTGWVKYSEVTNYLSSMDICVASEPSDPYNDRSTAAKLMEYMTLEKPIVTFDLPEHRFTAQNAAVYARPNDESDFAKRLVSLMDDPEKQRQMRHAGRERIEKELAWHHQAQALLNIYETLSE